MPYRIGYAREVEAQLRALNARQRAIVMDGIWRQLRLTPFEATRNRKPMRPNDLASWDLRLGAIRVYEDVNDESEDEVIILALGVKYRNRVRIGARDYKL